MKYIIKNKIDNTILSSDKLFIGFYCDFDKNTKSPVLFFTEKEAKKEAKKWNVGGMFPVRPYVSEFGE
jgi:hypothetical protein